MGTQEGKYLEALEGAERFTVDGSTLLIYSKGTNQPLRLMRMKAVFHRGWFYLTCDFQPEELSILPVTPLDSSEARNTNTSVTDSGLLP